MELSLSKNEQGIRRIFLISLILKGINSILELFAGAFLLFTGSATLILAGLIQGELVEDPTDFLANHLARLLPYFSTHGQLYAALYLISHGVIKIILVIALLRNKAWAYPWMIAVLCLFIIYQFYRLSFGFSYVLTFLTFFDILLVYLTWHEYKLLKKHMYHV